MRKTAGSGTRADAAVADAILAALRAEGISDAEQVRDLIADYSAIADERRAMHERYEVPAPVVDAGGHLLCPGCRWELYRRSPHCPRCGRRLEWRHGKGEERERQ